MKKSRCTEEQICVAVRQTEVGRMAKELARRRGVDKAPPSAWTVKLGGMDVNKARRLRDLQQKNSQLKKRVAAVSLGEDAFQTAIRRIGWRFGLDGAWRQS